MKTAASFTFAATALSLFSLAPSSSAQLLFQDNFDSLDSGGFWNTYLSGGDASADFAFNYSTLGIPAAPNSSGTTVGLRFLVNQSQGVFQGVSASPVDQHFTGDFILRFDAWMNFVGPFPAGGSGSTQMASFGWGSSGARVEWAGDTRSLLFAASGDGGTTQDYRVYRGAGGAPMLPSTGVYAAGTVDSRNNSNPYYAPLGSEVAPAAQTAEFPLQSGTTAAGTFGMAWRDVVIERAGDTVTWSVDGLRIATVPIGDITLGGDNITFGMFDINATSSGDVNDFLNTAIYDNIRVTVPEPSAALLMLGGAALLLHRRRSRA